MQRIGNNSQDISVYDNSLSILEGITIKFLDFKRNRCQVGACGAVIFASKIKISDCFYRRRCTRQLILYLVYGRKIEHTQN